MKHVLLFENFQLGDDTITLYHGTCDSNAERLLENGWEANAGQMGGNMGQTRYLYLSSGWEDALWFAEEKGCNVVLEIRDIPLASLKPDPEDEAGYSMSELLDDLADVNGMGFPRKFVLTQPLPASHFTIFKNK